MIALDRQREDLMKAEGHLLIRGGPGSGKTTIALLKADEEARVGRLKDYQRVLFLSFARATVARVQERAAEIVSERGWTSLEVGTYHGFCWSLLRSHCYLLNGRKRVELLPPPEAAARFAGIPDGAPLTEELRRVFRDEGVVHFDLFAELAGDLLYQSASIRRIFSSTYPTIVLDEFQDTNAAEWRLIQALGATSRLVALADADQRIYEFRGASPQRIGEFEDAYHPRVFDFGLENNRSTGTDIVAFGNDLLTGRNHRVSYSDVECVGYRILKGALIHLDLKLQLYRALKRLQARSVRDWSLAVLVPTNQLMSDVSDYLSIEHLLKEGGSLGAVPHDVAFDASGPALAAAVIASALEGGTRDEIQVRLLPLLRDHIRGRKGARGPGAQQITLARFVDQYRLGDSVRGSARKVLIEQCRRISNALAVCQFSGNVEHDWLVVRRFFEDCSSAPLLAVATDAKYLRLLHKGSVLRSRLGERWRSGGNYRGAGAAVKDALIQEHFSAGLKTWKGVHVMTIHKSKGKEFDEVIIYEGLHRHRLASRGSSSNRIAEARRNLRVAVTRARYRATILTPGRDRSILL